MNPTDTREELLVELVNAGLAPDRLAPWSTWKVFKAFLRREVFDVYDAASFQVSCEDEHVGPQRLLVLYLVRQFSTRSRGGGDFLIGRLVIELAYPETRFAAPTDVEIWTHDFPSLAEWASVVEGLPLFQAAMNVEPIHSSIYYEAD